MRTKLHLILMVGVIILSLNWSIHLFAATPTVPASSPSVSSITTNSATISWTNGDGSSRLVIVREGSAPSGGPVDMTTYTADADFSDSGSALGDGKVVYASTANNFSLTGLTAGTTYHVQVFEYNGGAGSEEYLLTSAPTTSFTTQATEPTAQATGPNASIVTANSASISWTSGNGSNRLVIVRSGAAPSGGPIDAVGYTADANFSGGGSVLGDGKVVYTGTSNTFSLTGLAAATTYHVQVFEYNGSGASANYLLTSAPTTSFTTLATEPTVQSTGPNASAVTINSATISWTSGNGSNRLIIVRSSAAPSGGPVDATTYTADANFSGGGSALGSGKVVYTGTANNFSLTGLAAATTYHVQVFEYSGSGLNTNYLLTSAPTTSFTTQATEPTAQATGPNASIVTANSASISWTSGNGSNRLVIVRSGAAPSGGPVDASSYTADADFSGGGSVLGDGKVVYTGTSNTFSLTGLAAVTTYHVQVFEYNGSGASANYLLTSAPTTSFTTLATEPTVQSTGPNASAVTINSATISWTSGNGSNRLVIVRSGAAPSGGPVDATTYTADANFSGGGSVLGDGKVVYTGTSNTFSLTGLAAATTYHIQVFEYSGSGLNTNYLLSSAPTTSFTTLTTEPTTQATGPNASAVTANSASISWTNGNGSDRLVIVRSGAAPSGGPVDASSYTADADFSGGGSALGSGKVVYAGPGNSFTLSGLSAATTYHVQVFEYNGTGLSTNYLLTAAPTTSFTTLATEPTSQVTNINISSIITNQASISWTNGNGSDRLVIVREGAVPSGGPVDASSYTADANFSGSGSALGSGKVVYAGSGNSFTLTGLSAGINYHIQVFEYNGSGITSNYITSTDTNNPNSFYTTASEPSSQVAISFNTVNSTTADISWSGGAGNGKLAVIQAGTGGITSPTDRTTYTADLDFTGTGSTIGSGKVVNKSNISNINITNLTEGTVYRTQVFSFNQTVDGTENYLTTDNSQLFATEPNTQASTVTISSVDATSATIGWTQGDASNNHLVVIRAGSAVSVNPTDRTASYSANAAFSSGTNLGGGNYIIYASTGNSVNVTGLTEGQNYYVQVFEYAGDIAYANYNVTSAPTAEFITEPTSQASNITFGTVTSTIAPISGWTNGNGDRRLVVVEQGTDAVDTPTDRNTYVADTDFTSGSSTTFGDGGKVVFDGTGNAVTVTGLTEGTVYHIKTYEYNLGSISGTENYLTTDGTNNPIIFATGPNTQASAIAISSVDATSATIGWTQGDVGNNHLVVIRAGAAVNQNPVDRSASYTASTTFGSGTNLGSNNYIVFAGTGNSVTVTGLTEGQNYYVQVFEYVGAISYANYNITTAPTAEFITEPTTQASNIIFGTITTTTAPITGWTNGNGDGRIVVVEEGTDAVDNPTDRTTYNADPSFTGGGSTTGGGSKVVYNGSDASGNATITDLTEGTFYRIKVFDYNIGSVIGTENYLTSDGTDGHLTFATEPATQTSNITFSNMGSTTAQIGWNNSSGNRYIVLVNEAAITATPQDRTTYTANTNYSAGVSPFGDGTKVVYVGTGNSVSITGLDEKTTYNVIIFEYVGTGGIENYNLNAPLLPATNAASFITSPTNQFSGLSIDYNDVEATSATISWSGTATGNGRIITIRSNVNPEVIPGYGVIYSNPGTNIVGGVDETGTGNFVIYDGTDATGSITVTGLSASTLYRVKVYEYQKDGSLINYNTGTATNNPIALLTEPSVRASSVNVPDYPSRNETQVTINWTNGNGGNRIVVVRPSGDAETPPTDNNNYTASASYTGGGDLLGTGKVVYNGTGNSVTVTNLTRDTEYEVQVYEYSRSGSIRNYYSGTFSDGDNPLSFRTIAAEPGTGTALGVQDYGISFPITTANSALISWIEGTAGTNSLVVVRAGADVSFTPQIGQEYSPNTAFGSGTDLGAGNYVVYSGSGNNVSISGLIENSTYYVKVFSFNGTSTSAHYKTNGFANAPSNSTFFDAAPAQPQALITPLGTGVPASTSVIITFDQEIYVNDGITTISPTPPSIGAAVSNSDISSFVQLRLGNSSGAPIPFGAVISGDGRTIVVNPTSLLSDNTTYWVGVDETYVENSSGKVGSNLVSGTFTTQDLPDVTFNNPGPYEENNNQTTGVNLFELVDPRIDLDFDAIADIDPDETTDPTFDTYYFSGPTVVDYLFYPNNANVGLNTITFTYKTAGGFLVNTEFDINVIDAVENIVFTDGTPVKISRRAFCADDNTEYPIEFTGATPAAGRLAILEGPGITRINPPSPTNNSNAQPTFTFNPSVAAASGLDIMITASEYTYFNFPPFFVGYFLTDDDFYDETTRIERDLDLRFNGINDGDVFCQDEAITIEAFVNNLNPSGANYTLSFQVAPRGTSDWSSVPVIGPDNVTFNFPYDILTVTPGDYTIRFFYEEDTDYSFLDDLGVTQTITTTCNAEITRDFAIVPVFKVTPVATEDIDIPSGNVCVGSGNTDFAVIYNIDGGGQDFEYEWNFGDGTIVSGTNSTGDVTNTLTVAHAYTSPGDYTATLTIDVIGTTPLGGAKTCQQVFTRSNIIVGEVPTVDFVASGFCKGQPTSFDITAVVDPAFSEIIRYEIDYDGDNVIDEVYENSPISALVATHTFNHVYPNTTQSDTYNAKVRVTSRSLVDNTVQCDAPFVDKSINVFKVISVDKNNVFTDDFNTDNGGWIPGATSVGNSWTHGAPGKTVITDASSDGNVWTTGQGTASYSNGTNTASFFDHEKSWVESPCFNIDGTEKPALALRYFSAVDANNDGTVIQYTVDDGITWNILGNLNEGINWYESDGILGNPGNQGVNPIGWSTFESEWKDVKYDLDEVKSQASSGAGFVRFRVNFGSNADNPADGTFDGFAFDDFSIEERNRVVLLEHFTNTNSTTALAENQVIEDASVGDGVINIQYHTDFPSADAENLGNPADPSGRVLLYGVTEVPRTTVDGFRELRPFSSENWGETYLNTRTLAGSPFEITINLSQPANELVIDATVQAVTFLNRDVVVHVVVIENTTNNGGINVVRKMLPNAAGTLVTEDWAINDEQSYSQTWIPSNFENDDNLSVVVFIQDNETNEVYQAAIVSVPTSFVFENLVTSLDSFSPDIPSVEMYPIPVADILTIEIMELMKGDWRWQLYDMQGALVQNGLLISSQQKQEINLINLVDGMYVIRLYDENDQLVETRKIIIQK